jgi:hypothetical protein
VVKSLGEVIVMKSWKWIGVVVLGAALAGAGCGGDDDDDKSSAGSSGKSAAGASGKDSSSAGSGSPMTMLPEGAIACGKTVCELGEGETAMLCCFDEFSGMCGMKSGAGSNCVMRVESDSRCPSVSVGGMFTLPSCCTADNMCGINAGIFTGSMDCTELSQASMMAMMRAGGMGGFITFPPAKACE